MSRSSDLVDPLLGSSFFPKAKFSSDPSKPYDFDHDLQAINLHLKSTTASLSGLEDQAKNIFSGSSVIPQSDMSQATKCVNGVVPTNDVDNHRERRPALGLKRARFSLKPNSSQPDITLGPTFDSKKYKDPNDYFTFYERNENAKRELEKQMGGAVFDGYKQNPSPITRARRPGIPRRSVKYKHRISSLYNEIVENAIPTQETFEMSILSPLNHNSQTESHEKVALEEMDLAGSKVKEDNKWNNDILDGLLSQPTEDLEGDGAFHLLKESLHIKNFELEDICLPEFPDTKKVDLKSSRKTLPNPRPVKPRQGAEGSIHLSSPTPPKSPLASLSLLSKRSLVSIPSNDPFSAFDIDQFPVTNPSSVENRNKQSDRIDIAEQKMISDTLKSPLIKQSDKIEGAKTGSCEVTVKEFTNAVKRSKRNSLSKLGVGYDVDMEEEIGASKVTSETLSMPEDDTDTWANGVDNSDKIQVEDKLQEPGPEVNAADSTLEKLNGAHSQVADDVIDSDEIQEEDKVQEAMPENNEQDKLQDAVACAEHGFDAADSTVEYLNDAPSQLADQLQSAPVEEQSRDSLSRNPDFGLEKQNEMMQEHTGVSLNKPIEANSRPRRKQKKKEVSKRQSLAGHGTSMKSGVRRSTRIRTRPLEYWKGERLLFGRIHNSLPTVIGMKYASPGKGEGKASLKVKSFVSDKHKVLVDLVSLH
ncbi:centromere protein C isoform X3 [Rosa chinensis]|uniref:centromere protein C isoform X3 n=1 Tax=Rosa chinensis TaxID=74649 RepID=UPI000D08BC8B|nr:centromere protein C isoform X3 [Rosa chinensis]